MNIPRLFASFVLLVASFTGTAAEISYPLTGAPLEVVTNAEKFEVFATEVAEGVERCLAMPALVDDPAALKILLSSRVHLAHHFGKNEKAIATAAWIRSLLTEPSDKAFAGLTTLAAVAAREENPGVAGDDPRSRATFAKEFARQLKALPHTPEIVAMLRRQREKNADMSEAALLSEVRDTIAPAISRRGYCGMVEADQLIRVRHRLVSILPIRTETLAALDEAIAMRTSP